MGRKPKYDYIDPEFDAILQRLINPPKAAPTIGIDDMSIEELREYAKKLEKEISELKKEDGYRRR